MKSFSKATVLKLSLVVALVGAVNSTTSVAQATSCDPASSVIAPSASQPVSLSITGMHIKRESMDALWEITTSEGPSKFVLLGRAIGAAHDWFGNCTYPGMGLGNGSGYDYLSKNVTLWLWHSGVNLDLARESIYELIGETDRTARLVGPARALTGRSVSFDASDSMPAFTDVSYSWDFDNDGIYEVSTGAISSAETTFAGAGIHVVGVKVSRPSGANRVARTSVTVVPAPTSTTPGISIMEGRARVNLRDVTINMVWPEYATTALVSNDGAFHPSRTREIDVSDTFSWTLEDGGEGVYSTSVFVRFRNRQFAYVLGHNWSGQYACDDIDDVHYFNDVDDSSTYNFDDSSPHDVNDIAISRCHATINVAHYRGDCASNKNLTRSVFNECAFIVGPGCSFQSASLNTSSGFIPHRLPDLG